MTRLRPTLRRATGPVSSDPTLNRKTTDTAETFHEEVFATSAITHLKGSSAHHFTRGAYSIQMSCVRTFDKDKIAAIFPTHRVPALSHESECLGALIVCDEDRCSLFPLPNQSLHYGERYHHFLLRVHNREMLASVSLDIRPVTNPTVADFTRDTRFSAAWQLFETQVEKAKRELYNEMRRIITLHDEQTRKTNALPLQQRTSQPKTERKGFRLGSKK